MSGGWYWVESKWCDVAGWGSCLGVCVLWIWRGEVGIREVSRWWKAGQSVNGVESQACVVLCSLHVVVVDGNDALDGLW